MAETFSQQLRKRFQFELILPPFVLMSEVN